MLHHQPKNYRHKIETARTVRVQWTLMHISVLNTGMSVVKVNMSTGKIYSE